MSKTDEKSYASGHCQLRIKGHLDERWANWLGGMSIVRQENGETWLTGPVPDQAALHGVLRKVRDAGMSLLSVAYIEPETGRGIANEQQSTTTDRDHTKGDE